MLRAIDRGRNEAYELTAGRLAHELTAGRVAHDEPWLEKNSFGLGGSFGFQKVEGELGSALADRFAVLIDRRERYAQRIGIPDVATTHDRDIFRNLQTSIQDCVHRSKSRWIVVTEHGVRERPETQELFHHIVSGYVTRIIAVRPSENILGWNLDAVVAKGSAIAFQTSQGRTKVRCSDVGNPPATDLDQVLRRHETNLLVVHADKIRGQSRKFAVQQDI